MQLILWMNEFFDYDFWRRYNSFFISSDVLLVIWVSHWVCGSLSHFVYTTNRLLIYCWECMSNVWWPFFFCFKQLSSAKNSDGWLCLICWYQLLFVFMLLLLLGMGDDVVLSHIIMVVSSHFILSLAVGFLFAFCVVFGRSIHYLRRQCLMGVMSSDCMTVI